MLLALCSLLPAAVPAGSPRSKTLFASIRGTDALKIWQGTDRAGLGRLESLPHRAAEADPRWAVIAYEMQTLWRVDATRERVLLRVWQQQQASAVGDGLVSALQ